MAIPTTMRALKVRGPDDVFIDYTAKVPSPPPHYVLAKVSYIALNPTDWKAASRFSADVPHTLGCDAVGRIAAVGDEGSEIYKLGDRVAGLCYGLRLGVPESGAFGEYCLFKMGLSLLVPDNVTDEEAATIPVGTNIVGQVLYQTLRLPLPGLVRANTGELDILIYGGNTATGLVALQYARLSGCRVLTTCSPDSAARCKAIGAHEAFDYHDPQACATAIRKATNNNLLFAFDCIAEGSSLQICADSLTDRAGAATYVALLPVEGKFPRTDVQTGWRSGYTSFGESYIFAGKEQPAKPEDWAFAESWWYTTAQLLRKGKLQLGPLVQKREGGLASISQGLQELRAGRVRGGKLVYAI